MTPSEASRRIDEALRDLGDLESSTSSNALDQIGRCADVLALVLDRSAEAPDTQPGRGDS